MKVLKIIKVEITLTYEFNLMAAAVEAFYFASC